MNQEARIAALKDPLSRVAEIAAILEPAGISVRFLNYKNDLRFDNLTVVNIREKINKAKFDGLTRIGTVLEEKIIRPMIFNKVSEGRFKKPLIVVVITDGSVSRYFSLSKKLFPPYSCISRNTDARRITYLSPTLSPRTISTKQSEDAKNSSSPSDSQKPRSCSSSRGSEAVSPRKPSWKIWRTTPSWERWCSVPGIG